ncbi:hypothetical protein V3Q90_01045 [Flavobacterium oreochromis]|uniref:hypothetical protein n=1 Tax=Flavobacterium oreochromis TaxID=2906078 RepID=UPI00385A7FE3
MKNISKINFSIISFLIITNFSYAQLSYKFIEPNISISYNKELFEISNRYSNTYYNTENYDFKVKNKSNITITVKADYPPKKIRSVEFMDSVMSSRIEDVKAFFKKDSITIIEIDKKINHISDFLCFGFTILEKNSKEKTSSITCNHITVNDKTEITLLSSVNTSLSKNYEIIKTFLEGFKTYSEQEIQKEEQKIKDNVEIVVEKSTKEIKSFSYIKNAYIGVLKVNKKISSKLKKIRIINSLGKEVFTPEKNGNVYFACKKNATEENNGEAIFINSFGKEVIIPFKFKQ